MALSREPPVSRRSVHQRASNSSEYLLTSLVVCDRCGKHFVGGTYHGNRYRYRYYTCFSRHRYGTSTCPADRLPAEELDRAVLESLMAVYSTSDLFREAVAGARGRTDDMRDQCEAEIRLVDVELRKIDDATDRYLAAFEDGTMPQAQCGTRLRGLGTKAWNFVSGGGTARSADRQRR